MATLKIQSAEIEPFWATPEILLFLMMSFSNFFHNHMVHKDQNEISPTIYYGISTKTNEKDLKIPNLQLPDWKHPYWMSLYIPIIHRGMIRSFLSSWRNLDLYKILSNPPLDILYLVITMQIIIWVCLHKKYFCLLCVYYHQSRSVSILPINLHKRC